MPHSELSALENADEIRGQAGGPNNCPTIAIASFLGASG